MIALALDAAWGSLGWAICTSDGPLVVGHAAPQGTWRWARASRLLAELQERAQAEAPRLDLPLQGYESPLWGYPWELEPEDWRAWWGLHRARRGAAKAWARRLVASHWPHLRGPLEACPDHADDVAEAVLLGVGACRHAADAPRGPAREVGPVAVEWAT